MGNEIKKLGFGLMRLPKLAEPEKDKNPIDIEQVKEMVDLFLAAGFTYFDTAWAYDWSEDAIRQALVERYPRDSFKLATKCAAWIECKTREDAIAQFESSLQLTGAGYFHYYLLHNLGAPRTEAFDKFDMWRFFAEKKAESLIKHLGFSFHGTPDELEELLTKHPDMEFVQLQINYADWEHPKVRSRENYDIARRHGKDVIIMEPVKGGLLADPPKCVRDVFTAADPDASFPSWAIRFAADLEGVLVVLSGMSSVEQMKDNISYMKDFTGLTAEQKSVIGTAREEMAKVPVIPCTGCDYCAKVCPQNVGISATFTALNYLALYENEGYAKRQFNWLTGGHKKEKPSACIECGMCENACPQHISIREELKRGVAAFE